MGNPEGGGPAFPVECHRAANGALIGSRSSTYVGWEMGMTMLDYLAAKAMAALVTHYSSMGIVSDKYPEIAREAYELAAEMLKAREAQP